MVLSRPSLDRGSQRSRTTDRHPAARDAEASEVEGFTLAAGMGTWGFKGAPIFGLGLAEEIATGRPHPLLAPFSPDRFALDRMVPDAASAGTH